jgi:hypothetical protein
MDWIYLAQDRDHWSERVITILDLQVPSDVGKSLGSCASGGFSRRDQLRGISRLRCEVLFFILLIYRPIFSVHNQLSKNVIFEDFTVATMKNVVF